MNATLRGYFGKFAAQKCWWGLAVALTISLTHGAAGQLFDNLKAFSNRLPVGDPGVVDMHQNYGPKGIAAADLDGDGRPDLVAGDIDGSVMVHYGEQAGKFSPAMVLE